MNLTIISSSKVLTNSMLAKYTSQVFYRCIVNIVLQFKYLYCFFLLPDFGTVGDTDAGQSKLDPTCNKKTEIYSIDNELSH